jgi:putative Holliday junction resolvase
MARYLGIDDGRRRVGLSLGDSETALATPHPPILRGPRDGLWPALCRLISRENISAIVVGLPLAMDGTASALTREVESFAERLRRHFPIPVHFSDERLTSYQVDRDLAEWGRRPKLRQLLRHRRRGFDDSRAATLLLQDFFNEHFPPSAGEFPC